MTKDDIAKVLKQFTIYSTKDYIDSYMREQQEIIGKAYHNSGADFNIIVFKSGEVYQTNSDHETQGIELKTIKEFKCRFKSFTGEKFVCPT